ncbi:MAG: AgmX/PglI C-terminal domain-containing protein [Archangium sp.]
METTTGAPERRVLLGDAGAPLDTDRILAIALRWGNRPLTMEHVTVGQLATPLDGIEVKWEGSLPVFALADGTRAWVERENGRSEAGRRVGLELGEVLLVQNGELTLEARVQKRSERLIPSKEHASTFFGLVMAHTLMLFIAITTAMVITPQTSEDSIWGQGGSLLRIVATPWMPTPKRKDPVIEEKINDAIAKQPAFVAMPHMPTKKDAKQLLAILFAGGGGQGLFAAGGNNGIDDALANLGNGNGAAAAGDGLGGLGRDIGNGIGNGKGPGFGVGPLGVKVPVGGLPGDGLGKKPFKVVACETCALAPPGYDRDLVLKVVKRHQNQIRFCYESELNKTPDLAGKVTIAWTIDGTGAVSIAQVAESGLRNETVENCILQRVKAWKFPEPQGGQEVSITFPWVFQVAGTDE